MTLEADLYYSYRSPYSYLAVPRLRELVRDYDLALHARPVLPLAVRKPDFFKTINPLWVPYALRDTVRQAEYLGIEYRFPRPDPIVQDLETLSIAAEQPYIHRITRLTQCAAERGDGFAFLSELAWTIWSGNIDNWHEGNHIADAAARAGFDIGELDEAIDRDPDHFDRAIAGNQETLQQAGHWGVPTMVFNDEPFWGHDRVEVFLWRLKQHGLTERAA